MPGVVKTSHLKGQKEVERICGADGIIIGGTGMQVGVLATSVGAVAGTQHVIGGTQVGTTVGTHAVAGGGSRRIGPLNEARIKAGRTTGFYSFP